jgi:hypothetical protein
MSILPWYISKRLKNATKVMQIGCAISSGVLLGSAFFHVLPELRHLFYQNLDENFKCRKYPFAEVASLGVFFILICIDSS